LYGTLYIWRYTIWTDRLSSRSHQGSSLVWSPPEITRERRFFREEGPRNNKLIGSKSRPKLASPINPGLEGRIPQFIKDWQLHNNNSARFGSGTEDKASDHMHPPTPLCQGSQTMVPRRLICHEPAWGVYRTQSGAIRSYIIGAMAVRRCT
jgi:hypothetical protein